jgi:hypothetical protein
MLERFYLGIVETRHDILELFDYGPTRCLRLFMWTLSIIEDFKNVNSSEWLIFLSTGGENMKEFLMFGDSSYQ